MKDLDIKSLIIGILAAVLVTVAMGNALADKPVGKYQLAIDARGCWLVDTSNGKLWLRLGGFGWQAAIAPPDDAK